MKPKRVIFYGDSNTYGFDPRDPFDDRYPASVRWTDRLAGLTEGKWEIIARGQNGRCVPALPQLAGYIRSMIREVQPVDRIAVMLGTNDLLMTYRPDAAPAAAGMEIFLQFLKNEFPGMERMLIAPPVLFDTPRFAGTGPREQFMSACRDESLHLTGSYRKIAEENGALFADAGLWQIDMSEDLVHFSEKGHAAFAEHILPYFIS